METTRRLVGTCLPSLLSNSWASMKPSESVDQLVPSTLNEEPRASPKRRSVSDLPCFPFRCLSRCHSSEVPSVTPDAQKFFVARCTKWDDWRLKYCQLVPRSTGNKSDKWSPELRHIDARSTGSKWDDWWPKHRHLFARSMGSIWDDWRLKHRRSQWTSCWYEYCSYIGAAGTHNCFLWYVLIWMQKVKLSLSSLIVTTPCTCIRTVAVEI
jgi:hypothetical protein